MGWSSKSINITLRVTLQKIRKNNYIKLYILKKYASPTLLRNYIFNAIQAFSKNINITFITKTDLPPFVRRFYGNYDCRVPYSPVEPHTFNVLTPWMEILSSYHPLAFIAQLPRTRIIFTNLFTDRLAPFQGIVDRIRFIFYDFTKSIFRVNILWDEYFMCLLFFKLH